MRKDEKHHVKKPVWQIVNYLMVLCSGILCIILIWATVQISRQYQITAAAMNDYITCEKNAALVFQSTDRLTEQVQLYVMTMDLEYADAYFTEVDVIQQWETVLKELSSYYTSPEVSQFLQDALDISNNLTEVELYAMRLIIDAQGYDLADYPPELQNIQVNEEDLDLRWSEKVGKARTLVFGPDYQSAKAGITQSITLFLNNAVDIARQNQEGSSSVLRRIMLVQKVVLSLLLVQSAASFILILLRNMKKQKEQKLFIRQVIQSFATSIDIKDKYTNGHSRRVAQYAQMIARKMGASKEEAEKIYYIGLLHDIGKIAVPDEILNKPDRLSDEEYAVMKQHAVNGCEILREIKIAPDLALGAEYHHERYDGMGYPSGLKGDEIPLVAQIIAVADTFDAMYSTRPYRKQLSLDIVIEELKRSSGTQLNPTYVDALIELITEGAVDAVS